jgi:hypothetical protein
MTTLQQLDQATLQRIDEVMTRHCLEMATKMASPTWERHIYWVMTLQHFCEWEDIDNNFGRNQSILGYPENIYFHHQGWLHFVGENSSHKFFAQKRAKGWVLFSLCCDNDEVGFHQITSPSAYTGKLGWDIDIQA